MARPTKEGLDYISIDVDFFDDPKIMFVCEKYKEYGEIITVKLLLWVYKNGYYSDWNEEVALLFANRKFKNVSLELVNDVVDELLKRGFFNRDLYDRFGVLTSRGIQKRWVKVSKDAKRKSEIQPELSLLLTEIKEETTSKGEETTLKQEETPSGTEVSTQIKVNNSIVYDSKENKINSELLIPTLQEIFIEENKHYQGDVDRDYKSLLEIAKFYKVDVLDFQDFLPEWRKICEFIAAHSLYQNYNLQLVSKHIQSIQSTMKNGSSEKRKSTGRGSAGLNGALRDLQEDLKQRGVTGF